jgi:hypothetical protein
VDQTNIRQREEEYLEASRELDIAEFEYSQNWFIEREQHKTDKAADHATVLLGFHMYELKAKRDIARMKLELAYAESKESK